MNRAPLKYVADLTLWLMATPIAFLIRLEHRAFDYGDEILFMLLAGLPLKVLVIHILGLHRRSWRKISIPDMVALVLAVGVVNGILFGVSLIGVQDLSIPRSISIIEGMLALFMMSTVRMETRFLSERRAAHQDQSTPRRVLIAGAGDAGTMIAREMLRYRASGCTPVGFLDDDPLKRRQIYTGLRVLGTIADLPAVVKQHPVDEVLIAMPSVGGATVRRVVDLARTAGIQSRIIPGLYELVSGKVSISRIREVDVEDLLRRDAIRLDTDHIEQYLTDRVVLITGAGGSIGSEIARQVAAFKPRKLILLGRGENSIYQAKQMLGDAYPNTTLVPVITNIRDKASLERMFEQHRPDVVFHAAAHKHVPLMEAQPEQAVLNNVLGTCNLVDLALRYDVERLVNVSTDKAVNPSSVMGATKRIAEMVIFRASKKCLPGHSFVSVRFGNVLGSRGSVIPTFRDQITRGGPVTVTHPDMRRYFMTIPEASQLVLEAGSIAENGAVYVLDMGDPIRIVDLAHDLIRLSGLEPGADIDIAYTGIRPGEKLYEDLFTEEEQTVSSRHEKIFVATFNGLSESDEFDALLASLASAAEEGDHPTIATLLRRLIPTNRFPSATPLPTRTLDPVNEMA